MLFNQGLPSKYRRDAGNVDRTNPVLIERDPVNCKLGAGDAYRNLRGLSIWGVAQYDPDANLAEMPFFFNGGLFYRGLLPQREIDLACLGLAYGGFSPKFTDERRNSYELMIEANYKWQLTPFAAIQPNIQYIIKPSGGKAPNALVLGVQYAVTF